MSKQISRKLYLRSGRSWNFSFLYIFQILIFSKSKGGCQCSDHILNSAKLPFCADMVHKQNYNMGMLVILSAKLLSYKEVRAKLTDKKLYLLITTEKLKGVDLWILVIKIIRPTNFLGRFR